MALALVVAARRSRPRVAFAADVVSPPAESRSRVLAREIAALDAEFERHSAPDEQTRLAYEARRLALKRELGDALAEERRAT
jgi:hypothetical protein